MLRAVEPHCYVFAAPVGSATLVGASPELLVSRRGRRVRSVPLAGTAPRAGDPEVDRANAAALAASSKEREEHAIVVDAVAGVLGAVCDDLAFDPEPVLEPTANVWHLATRFEGTLRDPAVTALDLVAALHPTPAICGSPAADALAVIDELEPFDRGAYAGPVGWVDAGGDGEWAIALRCASIEHDRATLYAGAGIVRSPRPRSTRPSGSSARSSTRSGGAEAGRQRAAAAAWPQAGGSAAFAARRVSPSRVSSSDARAAWRPDRRSPHGSLVTGAMRE
jgi:isochorismate synthase